MRSFKSRKLLTVVLVLMTVTISLFVGRNSGSMNIVHAAGLFLTTDTVEVETPYYYRTIQADYDSVTALCIYGETFIINAANDSVAIEFDSLSLYDVYTNVLDTINDRCRTKPMLLTDNDDVSLYRAIGYRHVNNTQQHLGLPDTVTWVLQVRSQYGNNYLATIDSVCIARKDTGMFNFPEFTGTTGSESWELLTIPASSITGATEGDSVYLQVLMSVSGNADDYMYDDFVRINSKFSDVQSIQKINASPVEVKSIYGMKTYPNPASDYVMIDVTARTEESVTLRIVSLDGRVNSNIAAGTLRMGTNRYIYQIPTDLVSGAYHILLLNNNGSILNQKKIMTVK